MSLHAYLFNLIYLTSLIALTHGDCGEPGHSRKTPIHIGLRDDRIYPEGHVVTYRCQTPYKEDAPMIGPYQRTCINERWSSEIPKCPSFFNATNLIITIAEKQIIKLTWSTKVPLVSVRLGLRRIGGSWGFHYRFTDKGFNSAWQNTVERSYLNVKLLSETVSFKGFLATKTIPVNSFETVVNMDIEKCDAIHAGRVSKPSVCLDQKYLELYILDETIEDCSIPDSPVNSVAGSRPIKSKGGGLVATYTCPHGFQLDDGFIPPICSVNSDWSKTEGPVIPCIVITCNTSLIVVVVASCVLIAIVIAVVIVSARKFLSNSHAVAEEPRLSVDYGECAYYSECLSKEPEYLYCVAGAGGGDEVAQVYEDMGNDYAETQFDAETYDEVNC